MEIKREKKYTIIKSKKNFKYDYPVKRNKLRDKYPDVNFKDVDISLYNYEDDKKELIIRDEFKRQFLPMYIKTVNKDKENILFATNTEENWSRQFQLITGRSFGLRDGLVELDFCKREYFNLSVIENDGLFFKVQNDKEYLRTDMEFLPDAKYDHESIVKLSVDHILKDYNQEDKFFMDENYTTFYSRLERLDMFVRIEDNVVRAGFDKSKMVKPFATYYNQQGKKRVMPKGLKEFDYNYIYSELKKVVSICVGELFNQDLVIDGMIHQTDDKNVFKLDIFKNKGVNIYVIEKISNNWFEDEYITSGSESKKEESHYSKCIENFHGKLKKHVSSVHSLGYLNSDIKDSIYKYLESIYGDELDLDIMEFAPAEFLWSLDLHVRDNETCDSSYFYYYDTFDLGEYAIVISGSKYIKDQCICDMEIDEKFEVYKK